MRWIIVSLAVVAVVGFSHWSVAKDGEKKAPAHPLWEYKVISETELTRGNMISVVPGTKYPRLLQRVHENGLRVLGNKGWELCGIRKGECAEKTLFYFKRRARGGNIRPAPGQ